MTSIAFVALFLALLGPPVWAQVEPDAGPKNGFHLYSVTGSFGYSSTALGAGYSSSVPGLGGDYFAQASTAVGYSQSGPNGNFSVIYVPSYSGQVRYSNLQAFNQDLTIRLSRRLGLKLGWYLNGYGGDRTIETYLFAGNALSQVAAADPTLNGLSDALNGGHTSSPNLVNAGQAILYGTRVLSEGATTGLTYRPTTRLRWSVSASGDQSQARPNSSYTDAAFFPRTKMLRGDLSMGYSLTTRTEVGFDVSTARLYGGFGREQYSTAAVHVARKLTTRWFASGALGAGASNYRSTATAPTTLTYVTDLSLAYRSTEQTFAVNYNRYAGDFYGSNSRATQTYMGIWTWHNRGRSWSLQASGAYQTLAGGTLAGATVTQAGGAISRGLTRQLSAGLDYGFAQFSGVSGVATGPTRAITSHGARLSITWIPFLRETPPLQ
jgi:hypothetical protein